MAKLFTNPALLPIRTLPRFVTLQDQARAVRAELALLDGRDMADVDTGVNRENGKNRALALADKRQGSATQYLPVLSCPFRKKT